MRLQRGADHREVDRVHLRAEALGDLRKGGHRGIERQRRRHRRHRHGPRRNAPEPPPHQAGEEGGQELRHQLLPRQQDLRHRRHAQRRQRLRERRIPAEARGALPRPAGRHHRRTPSTHQPHGRPGRVRRAHGMVSAPQPRDDLPQDRRANRLPRHRHPPLH